MALIVLAALFGLCAGDHFGYDYTPPQYRFNPAYPNLDYNYQGNRPRAENAYPWDMVNGNAYGPPITFIGSQVMDISRVDSGNGGSTAGFTNAYVSGGKNADIAQVPWHAGIYTKTKNPYSQICGGSLVSTNVIISAAHCFWRSSVEKLLPASNYAIAVGKVYRSWDDAQDQAQRQRRDVREIKVPPRYYGSATNFQDDLAMLILSAPVELSTYVRPVLLNFDREIEKTQLQAGNPGTVAGWGLTTEDGNTATILQLVAMPYVPIERCIAEAPPEFLASITSDKICAGNKNGTTVCMGDSGGGLVFPSRDGNYLRGVVSTAPQNGHLCNIHTWATFTLISKHEWFIKDILEGVS